MLALQIILNLITESTILNDRVGNDGWKNVELMSNRHKMRRITLIRHFFDHHFSHGERYIVIVFRKVSSSSTLEVSYKNIYIMKNKGFHLKH